MDVASHYLSPRRQRTPPSPLPDSPRPPTYLSPIHYNSLLYHDGPRAPLGIPGNEYLRISHGRRALSHRSFQDNGSTMI